MGLSKTCAERILLAVLGVTLAGTAGVPRGWCQEQPPARRSEEEGEKDTTRDKDLHKKVFRGTVTVEDSPIVEGSKIDQSGSLVTTVSDQQIDDLYAQDLTSALRRVPGVVISRYNPVGSFGGGDGGAFFIRGHGSSRPGGEIMMLTDGIPRFVGIWSHPLIDLAPIDSVQNVDVYRSAQPVLLGNMAFAAVDMASKRRARPGSGGRFYGSYGSYDTFLGALELGGRTERTDYYVTAAYRQSDGHREDASGTVAGLSGRLGVRLGEAWTLSAYYEHTSSSVDDPGTVGAPAIPIVPNYDIGDDFLLTTLGHEHGPWTGTLKLYLEQGTYDWLQWSSDEAHAFNSVTDSRNYGLRWRETVSPWAGGELVFGLDHDLYGGDFVERHPDGDRLQSDVNFRNTAPYVMVSHTFSGRVKVTPSAGMRYNSSRYFGSDWGAQAGVNLGVGRHAFYANWAHAFNLPGVYAAVMYGGWGQGNRWQELEAEQLDHFEVGWLASIGSSSKLTASFFHDDVEDALRFVPPPPPPPQFANIGAYTVDGLELSLQTEPMEHLAVFVGGTFSDANPKTVPNLPRVTAVGGMTWSGVHGWSLNVDLQWVDERYVLNPRYAAGEVEVGAYFLANAKLALPLRWLGLGVDGSIFVFGENLTDEAYEYRIGYPMPGRMVQVGVDIAFNGHAGP